MSYRTVAFRIVPDVIAAKADTSAVDATTASLAARTDALESRAGADDAAVLALQGRATVLESGLASEVADREASVEAVNVAVQGEVNARVADVAAVNAALQGEADARIAAVAAETAARDAALAAESGARDAALASTNAGLASVVQLGYILCGPAGALAVEKVPGSGITYEFSGAEQSLA